VLFPIILDPANVTSEMFSNGTVTIIAFPEDELILVFFLEDDV
jgi:hypothetical protein